MFLDDYPLKSMEVEHEPSDSLLIKASRNRKNNIKVFIILSTVQLVCVVATLIEGHGERSGLFWAMLLLSIISLVVSIRESRSLAKGCSNRSVKVGFLGLVDTYVFSGMNTIEIRYPFKQIQGIAVSNSHIAVTMSRNGGLDIPVDMFVSERDMKGFAKALSVVARCELSEGDLHAV